MRSGVFRGGGRTRRWCDRPPWSDRYREFLYHFCTVFVSFISRFNRTIRVPRLFSDCPYFLPDKTAAKRTQTYESADKNDFYRAMRCISAVFAVMQCPSVCLSVCPSVTFVDQVKTNKHIFEIFSASGSHTILVFPHQRGCRYSDGNPPNGGIECKRGMIK